MHLTRDGTFTEDYIEDFPPKWRHNTDKHLQLVYNTSYEDLT